MHPSTPLIELAHCSIVFEDHPVLDDISFALRKGERWALIGANGSGKTLLLKMLRGDVWPTPTGSERRTYALDGRASLEPAGSKERIAYIGPERQDKYVRYGWDLSVLEVVTTGLFDEDIPLTQPTRAQRARIVRVLKRFGLWGLRDRRLLRLSYGQRRLALVARAFASNAPVLLLDEVFNGLDTRTRAKLKRALETPRSNQAWVLTTHRPKELPRNVTHIARIVAGRIVYAEAVKYGANGRGSISNVLAQSAQGTKTQRVKGIEKRGGRADTSVGDRGTKIKAAPYLTFPPKRAKEPENRRNERENRRGNEDTDSKRAAAWLVRIRNASLFRDYRPVLRNFDWTIRRGEHWAILGANGSGKSTLLGLLYGDMHPALGGTIERAGAPKGTRIETWKQRVGWVSPELQADHYLAHSIEEIVISGRYSSVGLNDPATASDRKAAQKWLSFFGITALKERKPRAVSYGQMRLALFARAMINTPELLLLDEPCTGLDGDVRTHVLSVLEKLARSGVQIVMAVHDSEDIIESVKHVLRIGRGGSVTVE